MIANKTIVDNLSHNDGLPIINAWLSRNAYGSELRVLYGQFETIYINRGENLFSALTYKRVIVEGGIRSFMRTNTETINKNRLLELVDSQLNKLHYPVVI